MTYMQAALTILAHTDRPLTIPEMTAVAVAHGLVRPRGKTPDRTMSSVLYRRMASDPDAPITSRSGRFWLRGRPLPEAEQPAYLARRVRRAWRAGHRAPAGTRAATPRHATILPPPPLRLPDEVVPALASGPAHTPDYAPGRRERAIERAGERGARLLERLSARRAGGASWDAERTATRLVAPLLAHLGYRRDRELQKVERPGHAMTSYVLHAGGAPAIALDVRRVAHDLCDDDAWHALGRAHEAGAPYAAVTNGRELRLYATAIAEAQDNVGAALALTLHLVPSAVPDDARAEQAAALWLLSRSAVADGALDAYVANRAVGATLLEALDAPDSPLARVLVAEVLVRAGLVLPPNLVLRHARLALRGRRGRDGEPLPEDIGAIAAVRGPRLEHTTVDLAQIA